MGATTIKISEDLLAKLGANAGDFEEKLVAHLAKSKTLAETNEGFAAFVNEAKTKFDAIDGKFAALPKPESFKLSAEDKAGIVEALKPEAKLAASQEVSAAIAKAGTGAIGTGKTEDTSGNGEQKAADDDYKAQWDKDATIRADFGDFKAYEAFKKNESKFKIKIVGR